MAILILSVLSLGAAESLADFRWKKRVLLVTLGSDALAGELTRAKAGLLERDVELFTLQGPPGPGRIPEAALANELRKRLKAWEDLAEVILLGKDGGTTLRWKLGEFSVNALFASIDTMPMRKREMKSR